MAKQRVTLEIPDNVLVAEKEKELKALRKEVTKLNNQIAQFARKEKMFEQQNIEVDSYRENYRLLRDFLKDNFSLYDWSDCQDG